MNRFLSIAVITFMGIALTGCSKDNNESQDPESQVVEVATIINLADGVVQVNNRSLDYDSETGVLSRSFVAGERVALSYECKDGTMGRDVTGLTAEDISADGKSAKINFSMYKPQENGLITICYPASLLGDDGNVKVEGLFNQSGTLSMLSFYQDFSYYTGVLKGTSLPASVTLDSLLPLLGVTIKDTEGNDITSTITTVIIHNRNIGQNYVINRTAVPGTIYCSMIPCFDVDIDFYFFDKKKYYIKSLSNQSYASGRYYEVSLQAEATSPYKMIGAITIGDKGKLICTDGHIHAYMEDEECTKPRVAKIMVIGSGQDYLHGMALAMEDVDTNSLTWDNSGEFNRGKTAIELCEEWNEDPTKKVEGLTWSMPTMTQWEVMGADSQMSLVGSFRIVGGQELDPFFYWSSTDDGELWAWDYGVIDCKWWCDRQSSYCRVRPCIVF